MVTLSAKVPDKLNSSLSAFAKRYNLPTSELLLLALKKLVASEKQSVHLFENDREIKEFTRALNARALAKME